MMIKLILDAGFRLAEVINLEWGNVNLQTGEIKIESSKNDKERIVWLNQETLEELRPGVVGRVMRWWKIWIWSLLRGR